MTTTTTTTGWVDCSTDAALAHNAALQDCARKWTERRTALGLKGVKADDAALNFVTGYATALAHVGGPDLSGLVFVVSSRGQVALNMAAQD